MQPARLIGALSLIAVSFAVPLPETTAPLTRREAQGRPPKPIEPFKGFPNPKFYYGDMTDRKRFENYSKKRTQGQEASDNCLKRHVDKLLKSSTYTDSGCYFDSHHVDYTFEALKKDCAKKHGTMPKLDAKREARLMQLAEAEVEGTRKVSEEYYRINYELHRLCAYNRYGVWVSESPKERDGIETARKKDLSKETETETKAQAERQSAFQPASGMDRAAVGNAADLLSKAMSGASSVIGPAVGLGAAGVSAWRKLNEMQAI